MDPDGADYPAIDFSIMEGSPEDLAAAEKLPPGAPGLAKILLVVTDEKGHHVRLTLHDITARLLGVETPVLPSIRERKKLALEYAQVCRGLACRHSPSPIEANTSLIPASDQLVG